MFGSHKRRLTMSKVYHAKNLSFGLDFGINENSALAVFENQERVFPEDFLEVAECDSDDLGEIFEITNHIEQAWWLNEGVRKTIDGQARSTSVGDVVVLSNGDAYVVAAVGWSAIGNINDIPLVFKAGCLDIGDADGK